MNNLFNTDATTIHVGRESCLNKAILYNIKMFPTKLLLNNNTITNRFKALIVTKRINTNIKKYETKRMV